MSFEFRADREFTVQHFEKNITFQLSTSFLLC